MPGPENHYQPLTANIRLMHRDAGARLKVRRWLPPFLWAAVILVVTSVPGSVVPPRLSPYDKAIHFTIYALFAVLLTRDIAFLTGRWRAAVTAIVFAAAFAAADEWHQRFIPSRDSDVADWQADSMGAACGALLWAATRRPRRTTSTDA